MLALLLCARSAPRAAYTERVRDFYYEVDITQFIYPYGKVTAINDAGDGATVTAMIDAYLASTNNLKSLQLQKRVIWNERALVHLVYTYIRMLGWPRELAVGVGYRNTSVRVAADNCAAKAYDDCCCRCLMICTIIPALVLCLYSQGHRERGMRAIFACPYHPVQIFEAIRPALHCPNYNMCVIS